MDFTPASCRKQLNKSPAAFLFDEFDPGTFELSSIQG